MTILMSIMKGSILEVDPFDEAQLLCLSEKAKLRQS